MEDFFNAKFKYYRVCWIPTGILLVMWVLQWLTNQPLWGFGGWASIIGLFLFLSSVWLFVQGLYLVVRAIKLKLPVSDLIVATLIGGSLFLFGLCAAIYRLMT